MRLQTATRIAIYAVLQLAADPAAQHSAAEIAGRFDVSVNHLAKVLRALGRAGLVEALRGVGGGYRFRGNPRRITLLDVIRIFEEIGSPEDAPRRPGAAPRALDRVLREIDDTARATLGSISIATLLKLVDEERRGEAAPADVGRGRRAAGGRSSR